MDHAFKMTFQPFDPADDDPADADGRYGSILTKLHYSVAMVFSLCCFTAIGAGTWIPLSRLAPEAIGFMLLMPDGTVMAHPFSVSPNWYFLTPDKIGGYTNGSWTAIAPMT